MITAAEVEVNLALLFMADLVVDTTHNLLEHEQRVFCLGLLFLQGLGNALVLDLGQDIHDLGLVGQVAQGGVLLSVVQVVQLYLDVLGAEPV